MVAFLIVLGFNLYWYFDKGQQRYFDMYSYQKSDWVAIFIWAYNAFGVWCLLG